jgi:hypothetical protein
MGSTSKRSAKQSDPAEQEIREQEVLRANRELAAYFKGRRTEREARAAVKIIKAFIRDRERLDPADRRPLPGAAAAKGPSTPQARRRATVPRSERRPGSIREAPSLVRDVADIEKPVSIKDAPAASTGQ